MKLKTIGQIKTLDLTNRAFTIEPIAAYKFTPDPEKEDDWKIIFKNEEEPELKLRDNDTKFTFNENVEPCDIDFNKLCDFFDKEDKEKTVHWSYINSSNQPVEKDLPIHYMMIDGERFDFPYGLQMREFFYLNDENLFPVSGSGWEEKGKCFGLFEEETMDN